MDLPIIKHIVDIARPTLSNCLQQAKHLSRLQQHMNRVTLLREQIRSKLVSERKSGKRN